jgi:hypothetical protein
MSLQRRRKTCERLIVFVPPRWSQTMLLMGLMVARKEGPLPMKNPCFIRKNIFSILQKTTTSLKTLSKNKRPITIVLWHLDTNYIIFRNVENLKNYFFSKKNKS